MSIFGFIAGLFSDETHRQNMEVMQQMQDLQNMQDMGMMQQMQDMQDMEMMQQMNDPYMTPGLDAGIDEAYHGIDHGMGIANPEYMDDDCFGSSSDDSFFGSDSDDSFFGSDSDDSFFGGGFGGDDFF